MPDMITLAIWMGKAFLSFLFAALITRLLTGNIRTRGLIAGTTASGSRFVSAGRVQVLLATLAATSQLLVQVIEHPQKFPDVPQSWLWVIGGSQLLYHGVKLQGRRNRTFYV